jgi:formyltetrahydrofolate deformylase
VHNVTGFLANRGLNIIQSNQFGDSSTNRFFMRVHFAPVSNLPYGSKDLAEHLRVEFKDTADMLKMDWEIHDASEKPRVLIMVSKIGRQFLVPLSITSIIIVLIVFADCLNDLLFRQSSNQLPIDIPLIVSNHDTFAPLAKTYNVPFEHVPVTPETKQSQEDTILKLIKDHKIDLVVLARYMQVLSPRLCQEMSGKIINIHHSFLPSFKGAKPYHQAFDRGGSFFNSSHPHRSLGPPRSRTPSLRTQSKSSVQLRTLSRPIWTRGPSSNRASTASISTYLPSSNE